MMVQYYIYYIKMLKDKHKLSAMLLEKFLDKTLKSVLSFDSMSVHDVLAWIEDQEKKT